MTGYHKCIRGCLILPGKKEIEFDSISIPVNIACEYNGEVLVHELRTSVVSSLVNIKSCVARVCFDCEFNFHDVGINERLEDDAFVKRMY